jgi:hypothetical protein
MLRKPIFMQENLNPNENLNLSKEQTIKQSLIKNEEESLKKEDFNKFAKSTLDKIKNDEKNYEAQTKQTNSEENNNKFIFKYKDFHNINNNLIILPSTIYPPFFMFRPFNLENHKENNEKKELQKRGRKTKREDSEIPHNKFANDNLRKKSKHIILSEILTFLNLKLKEIYKNNLGNGILLRQLLTLNHKEKANINIIENQNFIKKTLQEIFSEDISKRYTNFPSNHNKELINRLLNEEDEGKKNYFNKLFNITFSEALHHFQGKIIINELLGLKTYKESIKKYENEKDYHENLVFHLTNFEEIINSKKPRKKKNELTIELKE